MQEVIEFRFVQHWRGRLHKGGPSGTLCKLVTTIPNRDGELVPTVVTSAWAFLHPGDQFSRAKGRKVAAGRAIKQYIPRYGRRDLIGAERRRELWEKLFTISPKTRR